MQLLIFQIGMERYALDTEHMVRVLPMVHLKALPGAPDGVLGLFLFRNIPVPVIDLGTFLSGRPTRALLSTRILVMSHSDEGGRERMMGLLAERVLKIAHRSDTEFVDSGLKVAKAPYLDRLTRDDSSLVQKIEFPKLLPPDVSAQLYRECFEDH
jgi:chemotaxis-related protein WspB